MLVYHGLDHVPASLPRNGTGSQPSRVQGTQPHRWLVEVCGRKGDRS